MSDGRLSTSVSLQSSVGATSAEELAEKYQKLFLEFSRIKAQHSVLKKAVRKEQATNSSLQDECKAKEQELRTSLQQLDLLNFHNERLTKRIQSLQDSGSGRLSTGWLLGSAKKELEKSKVALEVRSQELSQKIEENEKLHKEILEVNSLYTQHVNVLKAEIEELKNKNDELQLELTRSHLASEEAINTMRQEKRDVEIKLDKLKDELRLTNAIMEKNEQKSKEDDDVLRAELNALRQTLSINLGLADETQSEQFNALSEKIDSESNKIIESFRQLQFSTRDYLKALKENSDFSHELSIEVRNASQVWQKNLQSLAIKFTSAQNKISELAAEKELLVKANESDSNKVSVLETEILRLRKELDKLKVISNGSAENSDSLNVDDTILDNDISKTGSQSDSVLQENEITREENGVPKPFESTNDNENESEDDEEVGFVYPVTEENVGPPVDEIRSKSIVVHDDFNDYNTGNGAASFALEPDTNVRKDDDAKQREMLIKNHYECKISQLKEQIQLADGKAQRFHKALEVMKTKLVDTEKGRSRDEQEIAKLKNELNNVKESFKEERANHEKTVNTMTDFINKLSAEKDELEEMVSKSGSTSR